MTPEVVAKICLSRCVRPTNAGVHKKHSEKWVAWVLRPAQYGFSDFGALDLELKAVRLSGLVVAVTISTT